jgi:hypothetical protein
MVSENNRETVREVVGIFLMAIISRRRWQILILQVLSMNRSVCWQANSPWKNHLETFIPEPMNTMIPPVPPLPLSS